MKFQSVASRNRRATCVGALSLCAAVVTTTATAGEPCVEEWDNAIGQPGTNSMIWAVTKHGEELIVGGAFTSAGGGPASRIASWNGAAWQPIGSGIGNCEVLALGEYDGDLIAGGCFSMAGGVPANRIARWDSSSWHALGSGLSGGSFTVVHGLTEYNDDLIVSGDFTEAGGVTVNHIARWDGSSWHALGEGMSGPDPLFDYLRVLALTVYNGELIAGGAFLNAGGQPVNHIARWNGSTWQPFGIGMDGWVHSLTLYDGDLIAAGDFDLANGVKASHVARWDGESWHPLGSGLDGGSIIAVAEYNGDLIAGGFISGAGGSQVINIARWNGSSWDGLTAACPGSWQNGCGVNDSVEDLIAYNGELIVAGTFNTAGGLPSARIATWGGCADPGPGIPGDLNDDSVVNAADLAILLGAWSIPSGTPGCDGAKPCASDLNADELVNAADLAILLGAWTLP